MFSLCFAASIAWLGVACSEPAPDECPASELGSACTCANGAMGVQSCTAGALVCQCSEANQPLDGGSDASDANADGTTPSDADARALDAGDANTADEDAATSTECGQQSSQAEIPVSRPVDVIFMIDNSGSMSNEIDAVERNINENFAEIIEASAADYRVIMITDHGSGSYDVCIEPPLASLDCSVSAAGLPANGERFFHEDVHVESWDSVCLMLDNYGDELTWGWGRWLREPALKVFVEISDDRLSCASSTNDDWDFTGSTSNPSTSQATVTARSVVSAIRELSTAQFGTAQSPNFVWHSLVGIQNNDPVEQPYTHVEPPVFGGYCQGAWHAGPVYQMLSISTGGLRYPVCAADQGYGYDAVFEAIAQEVVRGAQVECAFDIPQAPEGKFVDYESVKVEYTPGDGSAVEQLELVGALSACDPSSFYFEDEQIKLCDAACERVRGDDQAEIGVVFRCGEEAEVPPVVLQ